MSVCTMHVHEPQQLKSAQSTPSVLPSLSSVLHTLMSPQDSAKADNGSKFSCLAAAPRGLKEVKREGSCSGPSAPSSPPWLHAADEKVASQPAGLRLSDVDVTHVPRPHLEIASPTSVPVKREEGSSSRDAANLDQNVAEAAGPLDEVVCEASKRWKEKLDQAVNKDRDAKVLHLRTALKGLQDALPSAAKAELTSRMKDYISRKSSPEQFAEAIKILVDKHNVVVLCTVERQRPAGHQRPALATFPPKAEIAAQPKKRQSPEPAVTKAAVPQAEEKPSSRAAKRSKVQKRGLVAAESLTQNGTSDSSAMAWEALVSVCSRM